MRKILGLGVALLALGLSAMSVRAQALAERVPDDALIYVGWLGTDKLTLPYEGSHLKAVLDATTMRKFMSVSLPKLLDKAVDQGNMPQAEILKDVLEVGNVMVRYPTALYVGPMELKMRDGPQVKMALVCVAGADAEKVEREIKGILEKTGVGAGGDGMDRPGGPPPVAVKREGMSVVLTVGKLPADTVAMLTGHGGANNLAAAKEFTAAVGQVQKDAALTCYVSVPEIVKTVDRGAAMVGTADEARWAKIRDGLNLGAFGAVVVTSGFDGKDWMSQGFVGLKGPRTGLATLLDAKAVSEGTLKVVPQGATFVAAGRFDASRFVNELVSVVGKVDEGSQAEMEDGFKQVGQLLSADLRKDVLPALGDEWVIYTAPTVGGSGMMGVTMVNQLKNADVLTKTIDTAEKAAAAMLAQQQQRRRPFEPNFTPQRALVGGMEVHYINFIMVSPSWAVKDGNLVVSLMPQAVPSAFEQIRPGNKSILDNEAFIAMRKRLGAPAASSIQFIDLPRTAPDSYAMLSMVVGVANMFAGPEAEPGMLPPLSRLLPELSPAGSAAWTDEAGWHFKAVSPFPGAEVFGGQQMGSMGMASPALMAAVLLPSLGKSRELANRAQDAANLTGIAKSCVIYSVDQGDKMPEHLAQLVAANMISPKSLVTKWSGTTPLAITEEQQKKMDADKENGWKVIAKDLEAHCDYVYLGKGTKNTTDSSQVLIYDKPLPGRREGINIAFYDCHVEWTRTGFADLFKATNELRRDAKLKLVTFDPMGWPMFGETATPEK